MPTYSSAPLAKASASLLGLALVVTGCSSPTEEDAGSAGTATPSSKQLTMTSQVACDRYYAFDLFRRTQVPSKQEAGKTERLLVLEEYRDLADRMSVGLDSSVIVGDLPVKARVNGKRIVRQLTRVIERGGDLRDVTGVLDTRISKSAQRIESLCVSTNHPVPQQNLDARPAPDGS